MKNLQWVIHEINALKKNLLYYIQRKYSCLKKCMILMAWFINTLFTKKIIIISCIILVYNNHAF